MKNFEIYLIKVGIRSIEFNYIDSEILANVDYFKRCMEKGLSEYKALTFLNDYINGEYQT